MVVTVSSWASSLVWWEFQDRSCVRAASLAGRGCSSGRFAEVKHYLPNHVRGTVPANHTWARQVDVQSRAADMYSLGFDSQTPHRKYIRRPGLSSHASHLENTRTTNLVAIFVAVATSSCPATHPQARPKQSGTNKTNGPSKESPPPEPLRALLPVSVGRQVVIISSAIQ